MNPFSALPDDRVFHVDDDDEEEEEEEEANGK